MRRYPVRIYPILTTPQWNHKESYFVQFKDSITKCLYSADYLAILFR